MTVRPPDRKRCFRMLAEMNNFELSGKELDDFHEIISDLIEDFHKVEQMPSNLPVPREGIRRSGNRPSRQEDPFNAIVRRCWVTGAASGRLAGRKVGVKDNVCVAGIPMTCGSLVMKGFVPDMDATVVTRLLDAGAEITAVA